MSPVSRALDIIQGAKNAYLGILLPTLAVCLNHLKKMDQDGSITICLPLLRALRQGIQTRFSAQFDDVDCLLASAFHPHFKLVWVNCLDDAEYDKQGIIRNTKCNMASLLESRVADEKTSSGDTSGGGLSAADDFFSSIYNEEKKSNKSMVKLLNTFHEEHPKPEVAISKESFPNTHFQEMFIKYNTAIPSSAGVERLFSLGKDVLKPKEAGLSDEHFEMLVFLKGNTSNLC